jgi:hypothetical protein
VSEELAILLDLKHGSVPFVGSHLEIEARRQSILDRCEHWQMEKEAEEALRVVKASEFSKDELAHMLDKRRIPRRVEMRLKVPK